MSEKSDIETGDDIPAAQRGWLGSRYRLSKSFWIFLGASCLFNFGMFIFVLLYNLFLLELGYKEDFLGWLSSLTTAGNLVGTLLAVLLTRRFGVKVTVVGFFALISVVCVLRAALLGKVALLSFAFVAGLLFAIWAISLAVVVAQLTTVEQRPIGFSIYMAVAIGIGVVADLAGGHLPNWLATFWPASSGAEIKQHALFIACGLVALSVLPASRLQLARTENSSRISYPRSSFVFRFLVSVAVLNVATAAFNPFANAFFSQYLHVPTQRIGLIFSVGQFTQVVAIVISPLILRRLGLVWGVASMELAAGLSLALMAIGPPSIAAAGFAGFMAFQWMDEPAMESLLMTRVAPHEQSGAAAMMYMTIFAAGAITAPLAGKGIASFGYPSVMSVAAFLLLLGGLLFGMLLKNMEREETSDGELATDVISSTN